MIKLEKSDEPSSLRNNKIKWLEEMRSYVKTGSKIPDSIINKYNQPDVKSFLEKETYGKCMYCESIIATIAFSNIEHYRPKATYPHLTFSWENLGLACPKCNNFKLNYFDEDCPFVNPYIDNPDDYFVFSYTFMLNIPTEKRAKYTIDLLHLNRPELLEARKNQLEKIQLLIEMYANEQNDEHKRILKNNIKKEISKEKPYSSCMNHFVKLYMKE